MTESLWLQNGVACAKFVHELWSVACMVPPSSAIWVIDYIVLLSVKMLSMKYAIIPENT